MRIRGGRQAEQESKEKRDEVYDSEARGGGQSASTPSRSEAVTVQAAAAKGRDQQEEHLLKEEFGVLVLCHLRQANRVPAGGK